MFAQNADHASTARHIQFTKRLSCDSHEDARNEALSNDISKAAKSFRKFRSKLYKKMKHKTEEHDVIVQNESYNPSSNFEEAGISPLNRKAKVSSLKPYKRHASKDHNAHPELNDAGSDYLKNDRNVGQSSRTSNCSPLFSNSNSVSRTPKAHESRDNSPISHLDSNTSRLERRK